MTKKKHEHKPVIETIINTAAIAMTSLGIVNLQSNGWKGFLLVAFAVGLEWFKYKGREKNLW